MPRYGSSSSATSAVSGIMFRAPEIAPLRGDFAEPIEKPWEGSVTRKPWEWRVTAIIPHLDQFEPLKAVLATLRAQTERPYLMIIDTGSQPQTLEQVASLAADDCEVHFLRPHAWRYTSQPVAAAMDMAFGLCQTEFAYGTHTDVFLRRPDYIAKLVGLCGRLHPVVGYQMSPRTWISQLWREMLSHTATLYHMPSMRELGATWNMDRALEMLGMTEVDRSTGWPDTEVALSLTLRENGIPARWLDNERARFVDRCCLMIGNEENEPYFDGNLSHVRSTTVRTLYDRRRLRTDLLQSESQAAIKNAAAWKGWLSRMKWSMAGFEMQTARVLGG